MKDSLMARWATIISCAALLCLISGCITENTPTDKATTPQSTSTLQTQKEGETTTLKSETFPQTTLVPKPTTTVFGIEECENMSGLNRDICYFGIAVIRNNRTLCGFIRDGFRRETCINTTGIEPEDNSSTIIEVYVTNKTTGEGFRNITVDVYSITKGNETNPTASCRTDKKGRCQMKVPGGDDYRIYVRIGEVNPSQDLLETKRGMQYIREFRMY